MTHLTEARRPDSWRNREEDRHRRSHRGRVLAGARHVRLFVVIGRGGTRRRPGPPRSRRPAMLEAGTLKICAPNDGTPPSVYHDETGALVGSEVDLGKALAAQMGLEAAIRASPPSPRVIPTLQAKQCDVIMAQLYIKPEREAVVDFVPYVYSGTGIAVSKETPGRHHRHGRQPVRQEGDRRGRHHRRVAGTGAVRQVHGRRQTGDRHQPQQPRRRVDSAGAERAGRRLPRHRRDARLLRHQDRARRSRWPASRSAPSRSAPRR